MYRSTPHSVTLRSPAELMFGRTIRDNILSINQFLETDDGLREKDSDQKEKGKIYADQKRKAKFSEIKEGNVVIAKRQITTNKLDSNFENKKYKVVKKNGGETVIECLETGKRFRRNVAHLKQFPMNSKYQNEISPISKSSTNGQVGIGDQYDNWSKTESSGEAEGFYS